MHTFSGIGKNFNGSVTITIPSVAITGSYTNNCTLTVATALSGAGALIQATGATRAAGATLNIGGTATITTLTATGTYNTVNYYAAGAQNINGTTSYYNLVLSGSGAKTLAATTTSMDSLSLNGTATTITVVGLAIGGGSPGGLSVGDGTTFTVAGFALTVNGPTIVGYGTSGTLTINNVAGGAKVFNGTVTINLGALLNETVASAITFGSDVNNYGTLTESGAAAVGFAGNFTNNGAYNSTTGMHTFSGTAKNLYGTIAYATGNATISGTYTNNGTFTVSNAFAGGGTLQNGATGILNINFAWGAVTPVLDASTYPGNTVSYGNNGAQTVQAVNYYNLTLTSVAAGIKTIAGAGTIAINGLLSITGSATANVGASTTSTANMLSLAGVGKLQVHGEALFQPRQIRTLLLELYQAVI